MTVYTYEDGYSSGTRDRKMYSKPYFVLRDDRLYRSVNGILTVAVAPEHFDYARGYVDGFKGRKADP